MSKNCRRMATLLCCAPLGFVFPAAGEEALTDGEVTVEEYTEEIPDGAEELTASCRFETNGNTKDYTLMTDRDLSTFFPFR